MKSFVFAVILLAVVIALTVSVAVISVSSVERVLDEVEAALTADRDDRAEAVASITAEWERTKWIVTVGIHRKESTRTETLLCSLSEICARDHTDIEYFGVCRLLSEELLHIKELESPAWNNIL